MPPQGPNVNAPRKRLPSPRLGNWSDGLLKQARSLQGAGYLTLVVFHSPVVSYLPLKEASLWPGSTAIQHTSAGVLLGLPRP